MLQNGGNLHLRPEAGIAGSTVTAEAVRLDRTTIGSERSLR